MELVYLDDQDNVVTMWWLLQRIAYKSPRL
jgi:hypothetical protein